MGDSESLWLMTLNTAWRWDHWSNFQDYYYPLSDLEADFLFPVSVCCPEQRERWWRWWGWSLRWGIEASGLRKGGVLAGVSQLRYSAFTHPIALLARCFPVFRALMSSGYSSLLYSLFAAVPMCLQMFPPELTSVSGICKWIKLTQKCLAVAQRWDGVGIWDHPTPWDAAAVPGWWSPPVKCCQLNAKMDLCNKAFHNEKKNKKNPWLNKAGFALQVQPFGLVLSSLEHSISQACLSLREE